MYKVSLNILSQRRRWATPAYTDRRSGPHHAPTFHSTVVVGGDKFSSPEAGGTTKLAAQDLAAMVALENLSALPAPPPPPPGPETQVPYKSQLQEYAQKRHKGLPSYDTIQSGPPHSQMFMSTVTIDGQQFQSPRDYSTKKEAESAAAAAALMSLNQEEKPSEQMLLAGSSSCISLPRTQANYKLQLQTYAQKRGKLLPSYRLIQEGPPHATLFKSIVTIDGQTFQSPKSCLTIKAAESAAANLALLFLLQDTSTQEQLRAGSSSCISSRTQPNYKPQLQIYAQKRGKPLPSYRFIQEGPPHATLFKSIVTVDGQTFQSPNSCRTIKAAESAAANLALVFLLQDTSTQEQLRVQAMLYASSDNPDSSPGASSKKQKINASC